MWAGIAVAALAAVQLYFVQEMLAALFIFTIVFAVVASVFLMLWLIDRAGQRTLAWAEPQTRELARLARRGVAIAEELGKKWTHTGAAHS